MQRVGPHLWAALAIADNPDAAEGSPDIHFGQLMKGRAVAVDIELRTARVELAHGGSTVARLPQHVSPGWLHAAVDVEPVETVVASLTAEDAILWCVLPGSAHASVVVDIEVIGRHITLHASESFEIRCSRGSVCIDDQGNVTLRGKELMSRASGANRIKGGIIRLN